MNTSLLPRPEGRIAYEDGRTQATGPLCSQPGRREQGSGEAVTWPGRGWSNVPAATQTSRSPTTLQLRS
jgi:hypothetical protein